MTSIYAADATAAMTVLNSKWFDSSTPGDWGAGSNFWKTPTICEEIIAYMALSGTQDYSATILNAYPIGTGNTGSCGYYDDETCWGRMFMAAYSWYDSVPALKHHAKQFLTGAIAIYQDLTGGWDDTCGGGVWWKRGGTYPNNTKAANATLGLMEIALALYAATNEAAYLTWGQKCWTWLADHNLITGGLVIGGVDVNALPDPNNGPVVALQGNPLYPLWLLYKATGTTSYLDTGVAIVQATIRQMVWPNPSGWSPGGATLMARVDPLWMSVDGQTQSDWAGETPFKGIFAGFMGQFTANLATVSGNPYADQVTQFAAVLAGNADTLKANFPNGSYGMNWNVAQPDYQPSGDSGIDASLQYAALSVFNAAARTNPS